MMPNVTLPPDSASGHWHEGEDAMICMPSGEVVLVKDTETLLHAGHTAGWPAGNRLGQRLDHRGSGPASYLVIGTGQQTDTTHYPDHDLITHKDGTVRRYMHANGTEYRRKT